MPIRSAKCDKMVEEQIVARGVRDVRVLDAMRKVDRHLFVTPAFQAFAYADEPLPLGYGQTISQPYIVAYMTEALGLKKDDRVLEIGTGSGYQAAILAELVREVFSMDVVRPLVDAAKDRLAGLGYNNVNLKVGDGYKGWFEASPFDAIIITAAPVEIPEEVIDQLKPGGRMIVPVGDFIQTLCLITKTKSGYDRRELIPVRFVPMVHRDK